LRLVTISGGYLVVDWIQLIVDTPTENHSWGSIKAQYETE
jgi:hypothetical protein